LDVVEYKQGEDNNKHEHESRQHVKIPQADETETDEVVGNNISKSTSSVYEKNTDCASWPIAGMVFAERQQGGVGFGSFHFPPHTTVLTDADTDTDTNVDADGMNTDNGQEASETEKARRLLAALPYMDTTKFPLANRNRQVRLPFVASSCHYHVPTRTFRGSLHIPSDAASASLSTSTSTDASETSNMFTESDVLVQFSEDFSYISTGVIIKRRQVSQPRNQQQTANTSSSVQDQVKLVRTEHPLDGRWMVEKTPSSRQTDTDTGMELIATVSEIDITGRSFYDADGGFFVAQILAPADQNEDVNGTGDGDNTTDDTILSCRIVDASTLAAVWSLSRSQWNRSKSPMGPEPGETLRWTRIINNIDADDDTDDTAATMTWTRLTFKDTMPPDIVNRCGGDSGCLYQRVMTAQERAALLLSRSQPPTYHNSSIWGNTFCQALRVGLASYHFVSAGGNTSTTGAEEGNDNDAQPNVYISYEHSDTAQWPALDNGRPLPSRVRFRNISFPDPHTFRGEIRWQDDYGTPWQGQARWEYEMKFDEEFLCIVSGHVRSATLYNQEEAQEWSRFGDNLIYINAALFDHFRQELNMGDENGDDVPDYEQYVEMSERLQMRLQDEGASIRVAGTVHRLLQIAKENLSTNPVDYNLE
jgi:hypothetical protein